MHGHTETNPTVFSLCVIDTVQTIFVTHYGWHVLVVGWGDPRVLAGFTWSTCTIPIVDGVGTFSPPYPSEFPLTGLFGLVSMIAQTFFAW